MFEIIAWAHLVWLAMYLAMPVLIIWEPWT